MLDGMVALETQSASAAAELYNKIPDRIADVSTLIGLRYEPEVKSHSSGADCLAVFVAYVRAMGKVTGVHQEFCGPLAKPQRIVPSQLAYITSQGNAQLLQRSSRIN